MKSNVCKSLIAVLIIGSLSIAPSAAFASCNTQYSQDATISMSHIGAANRNRLYVAHGVIVPVSENQQQPTEDELNSLAQERGKFGLAVKTIRKIYHKLPKQVKNFIRDHIGFDRLLDFVDHWTGALEDGIYHACKSAGMPDWMAWIVTQAIMLLL